MSIFSDVVGALLVGGALLGAFAIGGAVVALIQIAIAEVKKL